MALASSYLNTQKIYSLYHNIEDFTFSMPGGWDDHTISVFIEACHKYIEDLRNYGDDFMRQWSRIVGYGLAKTSNMTCFNVTVTMELAKVLKAYILKNEKNEEYFSNDAFKTLLEDTKELLEYFPNSNESQIPVLQEKKLRSPDALDKNKPESIEDVIKVVSKQYRHLFGAKGIPAYILWTEMSQKVSERVGMKVDVKQYLEPIKIGIAIKARREKDIEVKAKKFISLAKDYLSYFDYIPPRSIKKSEFLPAQLFTAESSFYKLLCEENKFDKSLPFNPSDLYSNDEFMQVEDVGAYCEIPYTEENRSAAFSSTNEITVSDVFSKIEASKITVEGNKSLISKICEGTSHNVNKKYCLIAGNPCASSSEKRIPRDLIKSAEYCRKNCERLLDDSSTDDDCDDDDLKLIDGWESSIKNSNNPKGIDLLGSRLEKSESDVKAIHELKLPIKLNVKQITDYIEDNENDHDKSDNLSLTSVDNLCSTLRLEDELNCNLSDVVEMYRLSEVSTDESLINFCNLKNSSPFTDFSEKKAISKSVDNLYMLEKHSINHSKSSPSLAFTNLHNGNLECKHPKKDILTNKSGVISRSRSEDNLIYRNHYCRSSSSYHFIHNEIKSPALYFKKCNSLSSENVNNDSEQTSSVAISNTVNKSFSLVKNHIAHKEIDSLKELTHSVNKETVNTNDKIVVNNEKSIKNCKNTSNDLNLNRVEAIHKNYENDNSKRFDKNINIKQKNIILPIKKRNITEQLLDNLSPLTDNVNVQKSNEIDSASFLPKKRKLLNSNITKFIKKVKTVDNTNTTNLITDGVGSNLQDLKQNKNVVNDIKKLSSVNTNDNCKENIHINESSTNSSCLDESELINRLMKIKTINSSTLNDPLISEAHIRKKRMLKYEESDSSSDDSDTPFLGFSNCSIKQHFKVKRRKSKFNFNRSDNTGSLMVDGKIVVLRKLDVVVRDFIQEIAYILEKKSNVHCTSCNCKKVKTNRYSTMNTRKCNINKFDRIKSNKNNVGSTKECEILFEKGNINDIELIKKIKCIDYRSAKGEAKKPTILDYNDNDGEGVDAFKILQNYLKDEIVSSKSLRDLMDSVPQFEFDFGTAFDPVTEFTYGTKMNSCVWYNKFINEYRKHQSWKAQLKWKMVKELQEIEKNKLQIMNKIVKMLPKIV